MKFLRGQMCCYLCGSDFAKEIEMELPRGSNICVSGAFRLLPGVCLLRGVIGVGSYLL